MPDKIKVFSDIYKLSRASAEFFVTTSKEAIKKNGRFSVALAGGGTPESTYALLATDAFRNRVDWNNVHIFWGDERTVPPQDLDSNYRMANYALISGVPIPPENVHRIRGEAPPSEAADTYDRELRAFFHGEEYPVFDLVFLGMGSDGHTASLFPYSDALDAEDDWVVANYIEEQNTWRITLTAPAINNANNVIILVSGESKAKRLKTVLEGEPNPRQMPIQMINLVDGLKVWLLDEDAASLLEESN